MMGRLLKLKTVGLLNLSYLIKKNKKGSYTYFKRKVKVSGVIEELEKNEAIDKKLIYLTVRVKKFDLKTSYFGKKKIPKKESVKN